MEKEGRKRGGRGEQEGCRGGRGKRFKIHIWLLKQKGHTPSHLLTLPSSPPGDSVVVQRMVVGMVN